MDFVTVGAAGAPEPVLGVLGLGAAGAGGLEPGTAVKGGGDVPALGGSDTEVTWELFWLDPHAHTARTAEARSKGRYLFTAGIHLSTDLNTINDDHHGYALISS
jgi:hypothetical protein